MNFIRIKKKRLVISVLAAGLAVLLGVSCQDSFSASRYTAWWGTLYPRFCFSQIQEPKGDGKPGKESSEDHVKISFWLAKALDW